MTPAQLKTKPWHLVIWIDHEIARFYASIREGVEEIALLHAPDRDRGHIHHHAGTMGSGHTPPDERFLMDVTAAARGSREILLVGPSDARRALYRHMEVHAPDIARLVVGNEPMPRSSEREIHAFVRRFFRHHDLMASPESCGKERI